MIGLVSLFARDEHSGKIYRSNPVHLKPNEWKELEFTIPELEGALIDEIGFCFHVHGYLRELIDFVVIIDDLYVDGKPKYTLEFDKEREEVWNGLHREISQFTKLKGLMYLDDGQLNLSC